MDIGHADAIDISQDREDNARHNGFDGALHQRLRNVLSRDSFLVVNQLIRTFRVPTSGIGLTALAYEISLDFKSLRAIAPTFNIPDWHIQIEQVVGPLKTALETEPASDLSSLRDLTRQPLRDFLAPIGKRLPISQIQLLRAIRALLSLVMLAQQAELPTGLANELARWFAGNMPPELTPQTLTPQALSSIFQTLSLSTNGRKLLSHIVSALQSQLSNPFSEPTEDKTYFVMPNASGQDPSSDDGTIDESDEDVAIQLDILEGLLARQSIATKRMFSGVTTYECLHPFELEIDLPRILAKSENNFSDESFAAELALILGIFPSQYHLISIQGDASRGFSIRADCRGVKFNFDKVIGREAGDEPTSETSEARFVEIPFTVELFNRFELRLRKHAGAATLDQLFDVSMKELGKSTRAMLRSISRSSHRITLSRLARSWGRYVLHVCRDEAYASAIAIDFTIGTTANFNYLTIRATRLCSILKGCYQRIGYSGVLATEQIQDLRSRRLPDDSLMNALIRDVTAETGALISGLPKHCSVNRLVATHNRVAINIYTLFKILTGTRPLEQETVLRSQLDLDSALASTVDKRIAPYHEERILSLPAVLVQWLTTYQAWLEMVAYRLSGIVPTQAEMIFSATKLHVTGDLQPFFFTISESFELIPAGSKDLNEVLARYSIADNGGRHWCDYIAREAAIDSASIMGRAGRGNAGQETFGRWSAATPALALRPISNAIDDWLARLDLTPPPTIHARAFQDSEAHFNVKPYIPKLLQTAPNWLALPIQRGFGAPEPCPFSRSSIALAMLFPEIVRAWRSCAPPMEWQSIALSLIVEDGVIHEAELFGALAEIDRGKIYISNRRVFVDSLSKSLGIRRTNLSAATQQLACRLPPNQPAPSAFEDFEKGDLALAESNLSVRLALASAEAYFTLHAPSTISAWARGLIFARTTRPETVARQLFGLIEHPKFDLRRRAHSINCPGAVADALDKAKQTLKTSKSHQEALCSLRADLYQIGGDETESLKNRIEAGYLRSVADSQENLNTLLRYESGARSFVQLATEAIEREGIDGADWKNIVKQALESRTIGSPPDITAINFVLGWLGIDLHVFQRSSAPPSARTYADTVSIREAVMAETLLLMQRKNPGDDYHLAYIALRILRLHPMRWDAIAHLRLCDLALDAPTPHLVVCKDAGADLKTDNAPSVHELTDPELVENLSVIVGIRNTRFPGDFQIPIFGDVNNPRSIETASRVHRILTDALWRASGSPVIQVHDLRHHAITERIHRLLAPSPEGVLDTLHLRQGLIQCSVEAGQSCPQVSVENYGHDFDVLRTRHYSQLKDALTPASDTFVSSVTGISAATLRKRRSRNPDYASDLAEGLTWSDFPAGATLIDLSSLVASGQDHIPLAPEAMHHHTHTPLAAYVGLRLLGEPLESARAVSGLAEAEVHPVEIALVSAAQRLGAPMRARNDINRQTFLNSIFDTGLAAAMAAVRPHRQAIARIERSLQNAGDNWSFVSAQDALDLSPWVKILCANEISTELLLRPSKRSLIDSNILASAKPSGFARARTLAPRHFERGVVAMLRFYPSSAPAANSKRIRASPQTSFLVGACALSIYYHLQGANHDQEAPQTQNAKTSA